MSSATRMERDSMGEIAVPVEALWGAQTQRSLEHFAISTERMPDALLMALARIKRVAARVNADLGLLDAPLAAAIAQAVGVSLLEGEPLQALVNGLYTDCSYTDS